MMSSKPICPIPANEGDNPANPSRVVVGLIKSSRSSTVTPLISFTGTTLRSNQPLSLAWVARRCDSTAYASTSSRDQPPIVAMVSAPIPCGTKPDLSEKAGSDPMAPPAEPIGTRDILSIPPATTRSSHPEAIFWAAMFTASKPDAQNRSSCTPATDSSQSAFCTIIFATSPPCSPMGVTQPITTSST